MNSKFPKNGFRDRKIGFIFQEIIFIPVVKYKTFRDKKYDETDFERLQEYAVSPFDMIEIGDPFIESKDGYLATSNNRDSTNYNDKKSVQQSSSVVVVVIVLLLLSVVVHDEET